ncbi:NADPH-dependent 7-cyano-7-deazaguanine reductase, partial [Frankliniella fusca]
EREDTTERYPESACWARGEGVPRAGAGHAARPVSSPHGIREAGIKISGYTTTVQPLPATAPFLLSLPVSRHLYTSLQLLSFFYCTAPSGPMRPGLVGVRRGRDISDHGHSKMSRL